MNPAASVSGAYFAAPGSAYFSVGKICQDQVCSAATAVVVAVVVVVVVVAVDVPGGELCQPQGSQCGGCGEVARTDPIIRRLVGLL